MAISSRRRLRASIWVGLKAAALTGSTPAPTVSGMMRRGSPLLLAALAVSLALPAGAGPGCTIKGTNGDDRLIGTAGHDVLCGRGGDDFIKGKAGNDRALGGGGEDVIILGPGRDRGLGQGDDDVVDGNGGRDRLSGGRGQDFLRGFGGADVLNGGRNRDCLYAVDGVGGNDRAIGGPGTDFHDVDPGDQVESAEQAGSCAGD
jgi:Ca2+-binding RTX toxin-like protein